MLKAIKVRIYSTSPQILSLAKSFGTARWLWNNSLAFNKIRQDSPSSKRVSVQLTKFRWGRIIRDGGSMEPSNTTLISYDYGNIIKSRKILPMSRGYGYHKRFASSEKLTPICHSCKKHKGRYVLRCWRKPPSPPDREIFCCGYCSKNGKAMATLTRLKNDLNENICDKP